MLPLRQLELTEAQRLQIRQLAERHRLETRPLRERLRDAADARRQAMRAVPVDEGRIRAAVEDLARVQADVAVQQARLQSEIVALLTPEQQQRLQQLRANRQPRP
jgi:Spy/CpxP family protein refolding chaperone